MENNFEYYMFREELRKLHIEYRRCHDIKVKQEISKDIELLENALENL